VTEGTSARPVQFAAVPTLTRAVVPAFLVSAATLAAQTPDWPQWGGPHRNFKSDVRGLAASWPDAGPRRLWSRDLGEGYSSIAAAGGALFTMYRKGERDVVISLDAATGKTLWQHEYDAPFVVAGREADIVKEYHLERGPGPMATPLVVGNLVFTVGATGKLHSLDRHTGRVVWSHDLITGLQGFVRQRGYTCSPLAYKNTIIVPVGAAGGALMAFNQRDGAIVWKKHDYHQAYASPILIQVDGQDQVVAFVLEGVVGVNPDNGDLLWSYLQGHKEGVHVSTPVWGEGNLLFISAGYGFGSRGLRLTRNGHNTSVTEVWTNSRMRLHFANAIRLGATIYGSSGDFGPSFFTAIDAGTGEILWQDRTLARGSFIYADGRFILVAEDGTLALAVPSAQGLTISSRVQLLQSNSWTAPTLVGKTLYVRDRKVIMALDVG
jgi:outer membrane protein assembly factor BamB